VVLNHYRKPCRPELGLVHHRPVASDRPIVKMTVPFPPFQLNNGISMPPVGLGCWMGTHGGALEVEDMVKNAIDAGYRKIDTASTQ
jgi:hypothetical protein